MCDQTEVAYLPNDVVWVKLGNVWWPGQVQDQETLDEDITAGLRKKPLAVVKFFDDAYEYVRNLDQIYHYNCLKKTDFIRKGLDLSRSRDASTNMKKFPNDISMAETLTGGDPNIIHDPKFLPEKKFDYSEIFNTKKPKGSKRSRTSLGNSSTSSQSSMSSPSTSYSSKPVITNSKIIQKALTGKSDYESRIRVQVRHDQEETRQPEVLKNYTCPSCGYITSRINVFILHNKSHIGGYTSSPNSSQGCSSNAGQNRGGIPKATSTPNRFTPLSKGKVEKSKGIKRKSVGDNNSSSPKRKLGLSPISNPSPTDYVFKTPKKRSPKTKDMSAATIKKKNEAIRETLLKDWDEEDAVKEREEIERLMQQSVDSSKDISEIVQETALDKKDTSNVAKKSQESSIVSTTSKSCFDFEDNEDAIKLNESLKFGQKLPRVISDKKPSVKRMGTHRNAENHKENNNLSKTRMTVNEGKEENPILAINIDNLLKETSVPTLPCLPGDNLYATFSSDKTIEVDASSEKGRISKQNRAVKKKVVINDDSNSIAGINIDGNTDDLHVIDVKMEKELGNSDPDNKIKESNLGSKEKHTTEPDVDRNKTISNQLDKTSEKIDRDLSEHNNSEENSDSRFTHSDCTNSQDDFLGFENNAEPETRIEAVEFEPIKKGSIITDQKLKQEKESAQNSQNCHSDAGKEMEVKTHTSSLVVYDPVDEKANNNKQKEIQDDQKYYVDNEHGMKLSDNNERPTSLIDELIVHDEVPTIHDVEPTGHDQLAATLDIEPTASDELPANFDVESTSHGKLSTTLHIEPTAHNKQSNVYGEQPTRHNDVTSVLEHESGHGKKPPTLKDQCHKQAEQPAIEKDEQLLSNDDQSPTMTSHGGQLHSHEVETLTIKEVPSTDEEIPSVNEEVSPANKEVPLGNKEVLPAIEMVSPANEEVLSILEKDERLHEDQSPSDEEKPSTIEQPPCNIEQPPTQGDELSADSERTHIEREQMSISDNHKTAGNKLKLTQDTKPKDFEKIDNEKQAIKKPPSPQKGNTSTQSEMKPDCSQQIQVQDKQKTAQNIKNIVEDTDQNVLKTVLEGSSIEKSQLSSQDGSKTICHPPESEPYSTPNAAANLLSENKNSFHDVQNMELDINSMPIVIGEDIINETVEIKQNVSFPNLHSHTPQTVTKLRIQLRPPGETKVQNNQQQIITIPGRSKSSPIKSHNKISTQKKSGSLVMASNVKINSKIVPQKVASGTSQVVILKTQPTIATGTTSKFTIGKNSMQVLGNSSPQIVNSTCQVMNTSQLAGVPGKVLILPSPSGSQNKIVAMTSQQHKSLPGKLTQGTRIVGNSQIAAMGNSGKQSQKVVINKSGVLSAKNVILGKSQTVHVGKSSPQSVLNAKGIQNIVLSKSQPSSKNVILTSVSKAGSCTTSSKLQEFSSKSKSKLALQKGKMIQAPQIKLVSKSLGIQSGTVFIQTSGQSLFSTSQQTPEKQLTGVVRKSNQISVPLNQQQQAIAKSTPKIQPPPFKALQSGTPNILQRPHRKQASLRQPVNTASKQQQFIAIPSTSTIQQNDLILGGNSVPVMATQIGNQQPKADSSVKVVYMTVDEHGNYHHLDNQSLISFDANTDASALYIEASQTPDTDNIFLSIDESGNVVNISASGSTVTNSPVITATATTSSQDILAKALANTQVLQSETGVVETMATPRLFVEQQYTPAPTLSHSVLETSLTLNQPIMTPLEVPSSVSPSADLAQMSASFLPSKEKMEVQPSMPLLTDELDVQNQTVFLNSSNLPSVSEPQLTFQLTLDNNMIVTSTSGSNIQGLVHSTDAKHDTSAPDLSKGYKLSLSTSNKMIDSAEKTKSVCDSFDRGENILKNVKDISCRQSPTESEHETHIVHSSGTEFLNDSPTNCLKPISDNGSQYLNNQSLNSDECNGNKISEQAQFLNDVSDTKMVITVGDKTTESIRNNKSNSSVISKAKSSDTVASNDSAPTAIKLPITLVDVHVRTVDVDTSTEKSKISHTIIEGCYEDESQIEGLDSCTIAVETESHNDDSCSDPPPIIKTKANCKKLTAKCLDLPNTNLSTQSEEACSDTLRVDESSNVRGESQETEGDVLKKGDTVYSEATSSEHLLVAADSSTSPERLSQKEINRQVSTEESELDCVSPKSYMNNSQLQNLSPKSSHVGSLKRHLSTTEDISEKSEINIKKRIKNDEEDGR